MDNELVDKSVDYSARQSAVLMAVLADHALVGQSVAKLVGLSVGLLDEVSVEQSVDRTDDDLVQQLVHM